MNDPDSDASRDDDFKSAFTNAPTKIWPGELGAFILGNAVILSTPTSDENLAQVSRGLRRVEENLD